MVLVYTYSIILICLGLANSRAYLGLQLDRARLSPKRRQKIAEEDK